MAETTEMQATSAHLGLGVELLRLVPPRRAGVRASFFQCEALHASSILATMPRPRVRLHDAGSRPPKAAQIENGPLADVAEPPIGQEVTLCRYRSALSHLAKSPND